MVNEMKEDNSPRNLEEMHESDLSPRERMLLERRRLKQMSWGQRLGYFWDYYKWVPVVIVAAVAIIHEGLAIYHRSQEKILLSVAVLDVPLYSSENGVRLKEDLAAHIGTGSDKEVVDMDTSVMSGNTVAAVTKRSVVTAAGITDVFVVNRETFEELQEQNAFLDWKELLGESWEKYASLFDADGQLDVSSNNVWISYDLTEYSPAYAGFLVNSKHPENAAGFVDFLFSGEGGN